MTRPSRQLALLGFWLGALFSVNAAADPSEQGAAHRQGAEAPGERHDKPGAKDRAESMKDKAESMKDKAESMKDKAAAGKDMPQAAENKPGDVDRGHGSFKSELRDLRDELKAGKLKKEDIKSRLTKLQQTRADRLQQHRQALKERWGDKLALPPARDELTRHERRMAFLDRMLFLAQTEKTGKDKDKLTERVEKLIDKENERHEHHMSQLGSGTPVKGTVGAAEPTGNTVAAAAQAPAAPPPEVTVKAGQANPGGAK